MLITSAKKLLSAVLVKFHTVKTPVLTSKTEQLGTTMKRSSLHTSEQKMNS